MDNEKDRKVEPGIAKKGVWCKQNATRRSRLCSKIRLRRALRAIRQETKQYFHETSLHGFKYITSPESTLIERFVWILVCVVGIVFCVLLMALVWQRFQQNPTVTTIETTTHPIWELDFPAVTICNFNKIYKPRANKVKEEFRNFGLNETQIEDFFKTLPKLIRPEYVHIDVTPGMRALAALGHTVEQLMQLLMQPCDKLLMRCAWLGQMYNCSKMFKVIKSVEGFCCAFNYHAMTSDFRIVDEDDKEPALKATIDHSINTQSSLEWIPGADEILMVAGSGRDVGLTVIFDLEENFYDGATRPYVGASILIHDPSDYPEISLLTALAEPGDEVDIVITGTIIQSGDGVRSLATEKRQCWFDNEAKLQTSDDYSYQTCVTECRIDHVRRLCNCVPFYYPNLYPNVRTCELTDINCMRTYRHSIIWISKYANKKLIVGTISKVMMTPIFRFSTIQALLQKITDLNGPIYLALSKKGKIYLTQMEFIHLIEDGILSSLQTPIDVEIENKTMDQVECNCLPQCNDRWYSLITQTANTDQIQYDSPMLYGLKIQNLSIIHVYFRDITCLKYRKDILLTWDGLFASFGGIFGLCLGGSVISLVELLYYYFIRIFHNENERTSLIYGTNPISSKLQKLNLKRMKEFTPNEKLHERDILKRNLHFHPKNYSWNEFGALSTELKHFRAANRWKNT